MLELIEARYHLHTAGQLEDALAVTGAVVGQLDTWGAWGWEERLCLETLSWLPERSQPAAAYQHQLGMVAQARGDYDAALDWYRRALAINEELGNRAGMASTISQIGILLTETAQAGDAIPYNLSALSMRLAMRLSQATIDIYWLGQQREQLGEQRFWEIVGANLDEESARSLKQLLNQQDESAASH